MILINILLGLLGLGIVILIHEFGHFVAAKLSGITVETFSLGWGKKLFGIRRGDTEYRISVLPIGGYCKMKGEEILKRSIEEGSEKLADEPGSLFSVSPLKRIITYFSGPFSNFLFAAIVLSLIWFAGFTVRTFENRIILLSEAPFAAESVYPSDEAGMMTGDRIVEMNGKPVTTFQDIEMHVAPNPGKPIDTVLDRNGRLVSVTVVPELDRDNGAGRIGVAAWVEPVISNVEVSSEAHAAGITSGDRIVSIDGLPVRNSIDLYTVLSGGPSIISLDIVRDGSTRTVSMPVTYLEDGEVDLGFVFDTITAIRRERNPIKALGQGAAEAIQTFVLSIKSIGLLFKGVNVKNSVAGPIRLTYFVGEVTSQGFLQGFGTGMVIVSRFLSLISVALGFMNLLPIPALDGGMILFSVGEIILKRPIRPKVFYRFQIIGFVIILGILVLTTFNDVFFFVGR